MVSAVLVLALNAGIGSSIGIGLKCGIGTSLVKKTLNTFTLSSPHNTSALKKTKVTNSIPMTNILTSYACKTGTAQSQQITTLAKLFTFSEL